MILDLKGKVLSVMVFLGILVVILDDVFIVEDDVVVLLKFVKCKLLVLK